MNRECYQKFDLSSKEFPQDCIFYGKCNICKYELKKEGNKQKLEKGLSEIYLG